MYGGRTMVHESHRSDSYAKPDILKASIPHVTELKFQALTSKLAPLVQEGLIVAFSGGVDSMFLLWAAEQVRVKTGGRLLALTAVSASMAEVERSDAQAFARTLGVEHVWEHSTEIEQPAYIVNDHNRCYYCKTELFRIGHDVARERGFGWLAYGYNASDRGDTRPGHRAALENNIVAPLADAELTKDEIRILMRAHGLSFSSKPASPCLSSRLMSGVQVTPQKLRDVEEMEKILRDGGLHVFRVRLHEDGKVSFFRIEVEPAEMAHALALREALVTHALARGYRWVVLDLAGYKTGGGTVYSQ